MLTIEDQKLINQLKETVCKLEADFKAGLLTEEEYRKKCRMLEEAADEIEEISNATH